MLLRRLEEIDSLYCFFLGRRAESIKVIEHHLFTSIFEAVRFFVSSAEFSVKIKSDLIQYSRLSIQEWHRIIELFCRSQMLGSRELPYHVSEQDIEDAKEPLKFLYWELFRRSPDDAGLQAHHKAMENGATLAQIIDAMINSAEFNSCERKIHLSNQSLAEIDAPYDRRLLETLDTKNDPERLITRFVAQESARIVRNAHEADMAGSFQERLGVLLWFLGDYAMSRSFSPQVPLSDAQVAALNAPAAIGGAEPAITVVLHNFVLRELPGHANLSDAALAREATYWWCVERAPVAHFEDRLVTPAQIELLRSETPTSGSEFPCNLFMQFYADRHPDLQALDLTAPRDRAALLASLVLVCALRPDLLRFLPTPSLRLLFRPDVDGLVPLDAIFGRFRDRRCGAMPAADPGGHGRELRARCETRLAAAGMRLEPTSAPSEAVPRIGSIEPRPGIGLIGPIRHASGLGRATRLSFETLASIEPVPPATLSFDLENPAPTAADLPNTPPLDAPRAINLLHLNAEAVPLAFAYGPRAMLAGGYNIGFFFWELNEIPQCHLLALALLDEIWVASQYDREIYARHTTKLVVAVGMAAPPLPTATPAARHDFGLDDGRFVFLAAFDSLSYIARKNPAAVIEAFGRAFPSAMSRCSF